MKLLGFSSIEDKDLHVYINPERVQVVGVDDRGVVNIAMDSDLIVNVQGTIEEVVAAIESSAVDEEFYNKTKDIYLKKRW
jgi:hypothetical protein